MRQKNHPLFSWAQTFPLNMETLLCVVLVGQHRMAWKCGCTPHIVAVHRVCGWDIATVCDSQNLLELVRFKRCGMAKKMPVATHILSTRHQPCRLRHLHRCGHPPVAAWPSLPLRLKTWCQPTASPDRRRVRQKISQKSHKIIKKTDGKVSSLRACVTLCVCVCVALVILLSHHAQAQERTSDNTAGSSAWPAHVHR